MNRGIAAAKGTYVARLDSDDVWLPTMLASIVPILDADDDLGFVYSRAQAMDEAGRPLAEERGRPMKYVGQGFRSLLHGDCTCNITTVTRRESLERIGGYDLSLSSSEDWDLWLRTARHHPFAFVNRVLARYRYHSGNITGTHSQHFDQVAKDRVTVLDKVFREAGLSPEIEEMKSVAYRNVYLDEWLRWLSVGGYRDAFAAVGSAIRASGRPVSTVLRAGWLLVRWRVLSRNAWGQLCLKKMGAFVQGLRTRA